MKQLVVIYWSGTGNTQTMAEAIAMGAKERGAEVTLTAVNKTSPALVRSADAIALGCPSMGDEILEEDEMEPFVSGLGVSDVGGKPMVLFGSYDWGNGQWMRDWEVRMAALGAKLVAQNLICSLEPDAEAVERCRLAGKTLVG